MTSHVHKEPNDDHIKNISPSFLLKLTPPKQLHVIIRLLRKKLGCISAKTAASPDDGNHFVFRAAAVLLCPDSAAGRKLSHRREERVALSAPFLQTSLFVCRVS